MDSPLPPTSSQRDYWNEWNASSREHQIERVSIEQADVVLRWLDSLDHRPLDIVDVGCGAGWLSGRLTAYGTVTGTDLAGDVLERAQRRYPGVSFIPGDFMDLDLGRERFDVAVSLEVLSHVADQDQFLAKVAGLLRPGGYLMLATQNRPALERNAIPDPAPGQIRRWLDRHELRALIEPRFDVIQLFSITPSFNRGILHLVNSRKVENLASAVRLGSVVRSVRRAEEARFLGWTLMVLGRRPAAPSA